MKNRVGVFDKLDLDDEYNTGPSIYYPNQNIRRMLTLGRAGENDVFCDLGSGCAQNVIMALTEFGVKRAFGFELNRERLYKSKKRLRDAHLSNVGQIIGRSFDYALTPQRLRSATLIYYGLHSDSKSTLGMIEQIERTWGKLAPGRKLVYHHNNLMPEIFPDDSDFPFYLSITQRSSSGTSLFKRPKSEKEWLSAVVSVPRSMVHRKEPTQRHLWTEFRNNFDVEGNASDVEAEDGIKERLRKAVSKNR